MVASGECTSVPMKTPRSCLRITAYHMRRRVARALDRGATGAAAARRAGAIAGLDELALGGDLTGVGVDEEQPPWPPRIGRSPRGLARGAARCFDARPAAAAARPSSTRRAYGVDVGEFAPGRTAQRRSSPRDVDYRVRCAATPRVLSERGAVAAHASRASSPRCARSSASLRRARRGRRRTRPTCSRRPSARSTLPRVAAGPTRSPRCSTASRPRRRSSCATARCSSSPTRAGCAPRSSSTSTSARSTSTPSRCASRARAARRASCPRASRRCARSRATSSARRPALAAGRRRAGAVPLEVRPAALDLRRAPPPARRGRATPRLQGGVSPARPAPLVRDPPARGRRGPARDPGAARARSISTTQIYTRVESARLRAAYARSHPRA